MASIQVINTLITDVDANQVSDGYHTFGELYDHRIALWLALCRSDVYLSNQNGEPSDVWRSKAHSDGVVWDGWFILGMGKAKGQQMTYHLPITDWEKCEFAETLEKAPEWDGHTSADVLTRLHASL